MIHNKKNSQWSYEQALSVLIKGLRPSSTLDLVSSVLWPVYYGNKLILIYVTTKLKECHSPHATAMWASNDCISVFNEVWSHMINI